VRNASVEKVLRVEAAVNALVLVPKVVVGFSVGSAALLADAVHSLTDLANNGLAWLAVRQTAQPADPEHPYGHGKFEALAVFGLATLLAVAAVEIALRAVQREPFDVTHHSWGLAVMFGVLACNLGLASWESWWARRLDSEILRADAGHTWADVLTTLAIIGGWQLAARGYPWADSALAFGISAFILFLAFRLLLRALPALVDRAAVDPELLARTVERVPGVVSVRRVRSRRIGSTTAIDVVVAVDGDLTTRTAHAIADRVEARLRDRFHAEDLQVHVEPDEAES
jgi:cation diffusion facilitator family transporter